MCGIAAVLLAPSTPQLEDRLHEYAPLVCSALQPRGPDAHGHQLVRVAAEADASRSAYSFLLAATVLHLRGDTPTAQPLTATDSPDSPVLCFNGEIYSGLPSLAPHGNDTAALYTALCASPAASPLHLLSQLDAEYALAFYQPATSTLWFGKDCMGRRSLLAALDGERGLCLSSVLLDAVQDVWQEQQWRELPTTGLFSVDVSQWAAASVLEVWLHYWPPVRRANPALPDRKLVRSIADALLDPPAMPFPRADLPPPHLTDPDTQSATSLLLAAERLDKLLSASVRDRVTTCPPPSDPCDAAVAILFSGGLDCTLLAHYAHLHTPAAQPIDLVNVAFVGQLPASSALRHCPDRITAHNSLHELQRLHPQRRFRLLCIDVTLERLEAERAALVRVLRPCATVMDFNIGVVLGCGAAGTGYVVERVDGWIDSRYGRYRTEDAQAGGAASREEGKDEAKEACAEAEEVNAVETRLDTAQLHDRVNSTDGEATPLESGIVSELTDEESLRAANPLYGYKRTPAARKASILQRKQLAKQQRQAQRQLANNSSGQHDEADEAESVPTADEFTAGPEPPAPLYTTRAKVLLCGIGADEMFAGYARHRTMLRSGGEAGLSRALSSDVSGLWLRNLGRDDRVTAQHGRELRTPFLAAPLLSFWQHTPLHALHSLPSALGGKAVLREVGRRAGLLRVAGLEKRAMQFGSRVSNRRVVGWARLSGGMEVREIVNPLFLREECRPERVRSEMEKREAKRERDKRGTGGSAARDEGRGTSIEEAKPRCSK